MEKLIEEIENLKVNIKNIEEEKKQISIALHIITVHCCNLISEKEGKQIEDVYTEISKSVSEIMNGKRVNN